MEEEKTLTTLGLAKKYAEQNAMREGIAFCEQIVALEECPYSVGELAYFFGVLDEIQQQAKREYEKSLDYEPEITKPKPKKE